MHWQPTGKLLYDVRYAHVRAGEAEKEAPELLGDEHKRTERLVLDSMAKGTTTNNL